MLQIADKDDFGEPTPNANINHRIPVCSIYSSESETSIGPKVSSTISTLPMGSPKHSADSSGTYTRTRDKPTPTRVCTLIRFEWFSAEAVSRIALFFSSSGGGGGKKSMLSQLPRFYFVQSQRHRRRRMAISKHGEFRGAVRCGALRPALG